APDNTAPDAVDDGPLNATQDTDLAITPAQLLGNDTDPEDDPLTITSVQDPVNGTVALDPETGNATFTPTPEFVGPASFTYTIEDGNGGTDTATVTINVNALDNTAPDAVDDSDIAPFETPIQIDVLENDTDPEGDPLTVIIDTPPENGAATVNPDGMVSYTPNNDFTGPDSFTYTIDDGNGGTDTATVNLVVDTPPTAFDLTVNIPAESPDPADLVEVTPEGARTLRGADPGDGTIPTLTITSLPDLTDGELVFGNIPVTVGQAFAIEEISQLDFQPTPEFDGGSFTYTATDNVGSVSEPATVTLNTAPSAENDGATTQVDTPTSIDLATDVVDPDGTVEFGTLDLDPSTPERDTELDVEGGRFVVDDAGLVTFTPSAGFTGTATASYAVQDDNGNLSNVANLSVVVVPASTPVLAPTPVPAPAPAPTPAPSPNQPPVAESVEQTIGNTGESINVPNLTGTDPDGEIVCFTITELPETSAGVLLLDDTEITSLDQVADLSPEQATRLRFLPNEDFDSTVSFTYVAKDDDGAQSEAATITLDAGGTDTSIPRNEPGDGGDCDCPEFPVIEAIPLPERPTLTAFNITGDNSADELLGSASGDIINGSGGDDVVTALDGDDAILAGEGNDLVFGDANSDVIFGNQGNDTLISDDGNGEIATLDESFSDTLYGNTNDDLLQGGPGDDFIYSGQDDDFSYGGQGNDSMWGDLGSDTMWGDRGNDVMIGDRLFGTELEQQGPDLMLGGQGDDIVIGNRDNDTLSGGEGNDTLHAGRRDDLVYGDDGDDLIFGDLGNDHLCGHEGNDTIFGDRVPESSDAVGLETDTLSGGTGNDLLFANIGNDKLAGDEGDDTLFSGQGNDTLLGGSGADLLFGDDGNDTITGGADSDQFVFFENDGTDTITDFQVDIDLIALGGGLTFEQLTLTQDGTSTVISSTGQNLAILTGVTASALTTDDFVSFAG
ncbi:MAG: Ig-like domain-containing protein, partial [Microcoleaceae cyanobacterium]